MIREDGKVFEVDLVVTVQVGGTDKCLVEDPGAVGGHVGNLGLREGIVVDSKLVD